MPHDANTVDILHYKSNRFSMKNVIICLIVLIFTFCRKVNTKSQEDTESLKNKISNSDNLKVIDTTIFLSKIQTSEDNCKKIEEKEAKRYLYKYFKALGALTRNEIKDYSKEILCIDYDTIYNLKSNKNCIAIISYWLKPADLNGTCVQPSMAIISRSKKGLEITNKEFVNFDFGIDSIGNDQIIYGYKFDCSEHKILKKYRLKLEIK